MIIYQEEVACLWSGNAAFTSTSAPAPSQLLIIGAIVAVKTSSLTLFCLHINVMIMLTFSVEN